MPLRCGAAERLAAAAEWQRPLPNQHTRARYSPTCIRHCSVLSAPLNPYLPAFGLLAPRDVYLVQRQALAMDRAQLLVVRVLIGTYCERANITDRTSACTPKLPVHINSMKVGARKGACATHLYACFCR